MCGWTPSLRRGARQNYASGPDGWQPLGKDQLVERLHGAVNELVQSRQLRLELRPQHLVHLLGAACRRVIALVDHRAERIELFLDAVRSGPRFLEVEIDELAFDAFELVFKRFRRVANRRSIARPLLPIFDLLSKPSKLIDRRIRLRGAIANRQLQFELRAQVPGADRQPRILKQPEALGHGLVAHRQLDLVVTRRGAGSAHVFERLFARAAAASLNFDRFFEAIVPDETVHAGLVRGPRSVSLWLLLRRDLLFGCRLLELALRRFLLGRLFLALAVE